MNRRVLVLLLILVGCLVLVGQLSSTTHKVSKPESPAINPGQSAGQHPILGHPSVSAVFIDRTLCAAKSPACGTGTSLYSYGVQYKIDPAYALAFFKHESSFGLAGVARQTKGLGNIRCSSGYQCIDGFRAYPSWSAGYKDWYQLIDWYVTDLHKSTIETIVPTYAPPGDHNDTPAYIASVVSSVQTWRKEA